MVPQHLQGSRRADTRRTTARATTQAPMLFAVRTDDGDRLPSPSLPCLGFCRRPPCPVGADRVFVCTAPQAPAACVARRAWRPERTRGARRGLTRVAPSDLLTSPTAPTLGTSPRLQERPGWTAGGLACWPPRPWCLCAKRVRLRDPPVGGGPGALTTDALSRTHGHVDACHLPPVAPPLVPATAWPRLRTRSPRGARRGLRRLGASVLAPQPRRSPSPDGLAGVSRTPHRVGVPSPRRCRVPRAASARVGRPTRRGETTGVGRLHAGQGVVRVAVAWVLGRTGVGRCGPPAGHVVRRVAWRLSGARGREGFHTAAQPVAGAPPST